MLLNQVRNLQSWSPKFDDLVGTHIPPFYPTISLFFTTPSPLCANTDHFRWILLLNKASTICFHDFLIFFLNGTSFFWKNRPPSALTVGVSQQDLSVALRPEQRPIGDHGSQPNAAGAVRWSGWEVVSNPETINIYIYVRCKSMFPHLPGEGL